MLKETTVPIPVLPTPVPAAAREHDPLEERTVRQEVLLDGRFIKILREEVKLPDDSDSMRVFLTHPGAAGILVRYPDGTVLLERQWRHPLKRSFWEIPAGKLDPNEPDLDCAKRELKEECGVTAAKWTSLGVLHNAIGYSSERIAIFLAEDPTEGEQALDEGEFLECWRVPFEEALAMAEDGRITDVKTITALFRADRIVRRRGA